MIDKSRVYLYLTGLHVKYSIVLVVNTIQMTFLTPTYIFSGSCTARCQSIGAKGFSPCCFVMLLLIGGTVGGLITVTSLLIVHKIVLF